MLVLFMSSLVLWACRGPASDAPRPPPPSDDLVARVNGVDLRAVDVELLVRSGDHAQRNPATVGQITQGGVETLVRDELRAQRAVALGLDRDPEYQARLREKEATLAAWRRSSLGDLLLAHETASGREITDDQARAYFREHAAELSTETHVMQILMRDRKAIEAVELALKSGRSFESVAAEHFPGLPETLRKPWDLGYLRWSQMPEPWKAAIDAVAIGGTSAILEGAGSRYWILHVVDRRTNPAARFEDARTDVLHAMELTRQADAVGQIDQALRENAQVEFAK